MLDEPTGQLDPIAAAEFLHTVQRLNRELGVTVILSEHRLEDALPMADRAAVLEQGRLTALGTPDEVARALLERGSPFFAAMPTPVRVWGGVGAPGKCPLDIRAGRALLETLRPSPLPATNTPADSDGAPLLQLRECWFRYDRDGADVLKELSLTVRAGELLAIVGGNGAGKSTALAVLAGQRRPYRGKVLQKAKRIAALCQEPRAMFVKDTVRADLEDALRTLSLPAAERQPRMDAAVAAMALSPLLERHPFDLSGANSSAPRSQNCCLPGRTCSCSTSRPRAWTRRFAPRSARCCARSASRARRWCSCRTTLSSAPPMPTAPRCCSTGRSFQRGAPARFSRATTFTPRRPTAWRGLGCRTRFFAGR